MSKIQVLPPQLSILVAAGEVVDRPRAVVKELVENAIDAGAKRITVESRSGGIELMRITDDGCGIDKDEVGTAFQRHATSKLKKESDLSAIGTLGFRGEALAAIAAVSRIDLITRTPDAQMGMQLMLEGGVETDCYETGCPLGTTIVVRDLFFNLPARAKFVKSDAAESNQIESVMTAAALSRPDIAFTYLRDGRQVFATQGDGKLLHAVHEVCGKELASQLMAAAGDYQNIHVSGLVSSADVGRANRGMQYFFVNGRPIKAQILHAAIDQAYKGKVVAGRHPACFLNINISLTAVDVNIHPAKAEVRFSNEKAVFSAVYHCICNVLEADAPRANAPKEDNVTRYQQHISVGPGYTIPESMGAVNKIAASPMVVEYEISPPRAKAKAPLPPTAESPLFQEKLTPNPTIFIDADEEEEETTPQASPPAIAAPAATADMPVEATPVKVIGEAFQTYILLQDAHGLWLIDKHAAHEKMLYDRLRQETGEIPSQLLLTPLKVSLSAEEKSVLLEHGEALERAGFEVEELGAATLVVRQIPTYLEEGDVTFVLTDLAGKWAGNQNSLNEIYDNLLKSIACRGAIKGGQESALPELQRFCQILMDTPGVRNCPHGRPVAVSLTRSDIEKLFRRRL